MQKIIKLFFLLSLLIPIEVSASPLDWPEIETTHRPGAYWHWPGSAVDKGNLTANMEAMRKAGMGGGTVVAFYGAKGYEDRFIDYLTPEWLDMFNHAAEEAERLGMWIDLTPGTAWPFGGPMVTEEMKDARAIYKNGRLSLEFSGRYVKRAAPGGVGYALNPFSPEAMSIYLKHFDAAFDAHENLRMPRAFYHDSFEYNGNWSPGLIEAFEEFRGYDLEPFLPLLFGSEQSEKVARIKSDYRETLSDLHYGYVKTWDDWAQSRGATTRNQAHGATANLLDLYAASGIPETETFGATPFGIPGVRYDPAHVSDMGPPQPLINRMASSAAHVTGKPLVASETVTWIRNHFRASLAMAKPEIDQLFLNGINHIFFHGTCYSPEDVPWPGWLFYAPFQYNSRNSIWRDAPALNAYIARCQSILQSGKPDNDIALYWPIYDIWHDPTEMEQMLTVHHTEWFENSEFGKTAARLHERGFGFDYISDRQLSKGLGKKYPTVLVPRTQHMPLETMKSLLKLEKEGVTVLYIDGMPQTVPGFHRWEEREA
ncbi:MAG: glycosyl hydrolase, partial [Verrucomicrobiota bacterium]